MTQWQRPPRPSGWRQLLGSGGQGWIQAIGGLVIGLIALLRGAALLSARVQLEPSELNRS